MPHYAYKGVDLTATIKKGSAVARSIDELDRILFVRGIALLTAKKKYDWFVVSPSIHAQVDFFRHLSLLVRSGIMLPNALELIAQQTSNPRFAQIIYALSDTVQEGGTMYEAMKKNAIFSPLMVHMVQVGHESSNLCAALDVLTLHLDKVQEFRKKLRAAALMPAFTFGFFLIMMCGLIMLIVPQLSGLFGSMGQKIPYYTQLLIGVSDYLRSWFFFVIIGICGALGTALYYGISHRRMRPYFDRMVVRIPFVSQLVRDSTLASFLHALSLLLHGGMQLVPALIIVQESIGNSVMKSNMGAITFDVESGYALSDAFAMQDSSLWPKEIIALVSVGQESGALPDLLARGAALYQERVERSLSYISTLFQPLLLIILGLLITGLIFVIYTPIINLSYGAF